MRKTLTLFLAACLLAFSVPTSCGTASHVQSAEQYSPSITDVQQRVWTMRSTQPEGFTVDIRTLEEPTEGIAVAYEETQGLHSRAGCYKASAHSYTHDGYVGGWKDSETGLYYFDSVRIFPEDKLEEALQFARENGV